MQPELALSGRQRERGGGDGEPGGDDARFAPSGGGFGRWGGMEGAMRGPSGQAALGRR